MTENWYRKGLRDGDGEKERQRESEREIARRCRASMGGRTKMNSEIKFATLPTYLASEHFQTFPPEIHHN